MNKILPSLIKAEKPVSTRPGRASRSDGKPSVGSVTDAIAILRHLSDKNEGEGVSRIAATLSISPSSCFNILKTLVSEEFLEFDQKKKTYRLGLGAVELARKALGTIHVYSAIREQMQALSHRFALTVGLWRDTGQQRFILLGVTENDQAARIHMPVGQRIPYFAGALGRVAASKWSLPDQMVEDGINAVRWQSMPRLQTYLSQVDDARDKGWAVDFGQWRRGVTSVAAPILDDQGKMQLGLTASMFSEQHDKKTISEIGQELKELADYAGIRSFGSPLE